MSFKAICEQVSIRVSSLDGIPVPRPPTAPMVGPDFLPHVNEERSSVKMTGPSGGVGVVNDIAVGHILFEPELLARCVGRCLCR